jgi:hypothetical protein
MYLLDATGGSARQTAEAGANHPMDNFIVPDSVFLCCERVRDLWWCIDLGIGTKHGVQTSGYDVKVRVLEAETGVIAGGATMISWPQQKEIRNGDHIHYGLIVIVLGYTIGLCKEETIVLMGMGLPHLDGESSRLYALIWRWILKSMFPWRSFLTSVYPTRVNACPTIRIASSTVQSLMGFLWGASRPSLYQCQKNWRIG